MRRTVRTSRVDGRVIVMWDRTVHVTMHIGSLPHMSDVDAHAGAVREVCGASAKLLTVTGNGYKWQVG